MHQAMAVLLLDSDNADNAFMHSSALWGKVL